MSEELAEYETGFQVNDDSKATWAMKTLREKVLKIRENERIAKEQIDTVLKWVDEVNGTLKGEAGNLEGMLLDYMRRERAKDRKSIKLAWGTLKSTQTSRVIVDEDFIQWAQENDRDDLLRFPPPEPNKSAIAEAGPLPHVKVVESVSFSVKVKE